MIIDKNNPEAVVLFDQWQAAKKIEDSLIVEFAALNKDGNIDPTLGKQLHARITAAHNITMDIEDLLQPFRLDE